MDSEEKNIRKNILDKLEGYKSEDIGAHWEEFSKLLDKEGKRPFLKFTKISYLLPALLLISAVIVFLVLKKTNHKQEAFKNSNAGIYSNNSNKPGEHDNATGNTRIPADIKSNAGINNKSLIFKSSDKLNATTSGRTRDMIEKHERTGSNKSTGLPHHQKLKNQKDEQQIPDKSEKGLLIEMTRIILSIENNLPDTIKLARISEALLDSMTDTDKKNNKSALSSNRFESGIYASAGYAGNLSNSNPGFGFQYRTGIYADERIFKKLSILMEPGINLSTGNSLTKYSSQVKYFLYPGYDNETVTTTGILTFQLPISLKIPVYKNNYLTAGARANWFLNSFSTVSRQYDNGRSASKTVKNNVGGYTDGFNSMNYQLSAGYLLALPGRCRLRISYLYELNSLINSNYFGNLSSSGKSGIEVQLFYKIFGK
jgi:hypothetical protein